nr:putative ribonuclease H-like domain-containing protein [Tanacetum cinerariifolium]
SDNGTEFKNNDLNQFCGMKGIKKEFSVPRTPQQNGIAERKIGPSMRLLELCKSKGKINEGPIVGYSSHVESFTGYRDLSAEFEDCSDNSINKLNAAGGTLEGTSSSQRSKLD